MSTLPIKMLKDETGAAFVPLTSTHGISSNGKMLNEEITDVLNRMTGFDYVPAGISIITTSAETSPSFSSTNCNTIIIEFGRFAPGKSLLKFGAYELKSTVVNSEVFKIELTNGTNTYASSNINNNVILEECNRLIFTFTGSAFAVGFNGISGGSNPAAINGVAITNLSIPSGRDFILYRLYLSTSTVDGLNLTEMSNLGYDIDRKVRPHSCFLYYRNFANNIMRNEGTGTSSIDWTISQGTWVPGYNVVEGISYPGLSQKPSINGVSLIGNKTTEELLIEAGDKVIEVTVDTAWTTTSKVGTTITGDYAPAYGDQLRVKFTNGTYVTSPTLNIDGSGARNIRIGARAVAAVDQYLSTSETIIPMWYDGGSYQMYGPTQNTNTTYTEIPDTNISYYGLELGESVTRYKIVWEGMDGKYYPVTVGNTTATNKTISTVPFKPNGNIYYYDSTSTMSVGYPATDKFKNQKTDTILDSSIGYALNIDPNWEAGKTLYFKGTINAAGGFVLDQTESVTTTLPTTENNFVYRPFGTKAGTSGSGIHYWNILPNPVCIHYTGGKIVPYSAGSSLNTLVNFFYPVGSIYETTSDSLNTLAKMNAHFGGTWEWFGEGRVTVCVDSTKPEFATLGMTGGHKDLQAHDHTFSNGAAASAGAHTHKTQGQWLTGGSSNRCLSYNKISSDPVRTDNPILSAGAHTHSVTGTISSTGAGDSGNLQPYVVVYRYRRTA